MLLLDTNVVSEMMLPAPAPEVRAFVQGNPRSSLFIAAVTEAELRYGFSLLSASRRRNELRDLVEQILRTDFPGRVLPFDSDAAKWYGRFAASLGLSRRGLDAKIMDVQIASIAISRGMTVATRNVGDFRRLGLGVVNPWGDA